jgi:hypothetical protein
MAILTDLTLLVAVITLIAGILAVRNAVRVSQHKHARDMA